MNRIQQQWQEYNGKRSIGLQMLDFVIHFRLHYQLGILSGGYLLAGIFHPEPQWSTYWAQFINVQVILFGTATAYNSFWDKDEGAIGGLQQPPPMQSWMWWACWILQISGALWALTVSWLYLGVYLFSVILFWLYSTPLARWKAHPIKSLWAIALSTGTNSFLLGYLASGHTEITSTAMIVAVGVALILVSMYPISQIFQMEEDRHRGDRTFAVVYGMNGVRRFYLITYGLGLIGVAYGLTVISSWLGIAFGGAALVGGSYTSYLLWNLTGRDDEYRSVMIIKYVASILFNLFIISSMIGIHSL
ncbi:MAG: UbiA family prenyltransferase [Bacteroidota bacterium]